MAIIARTMRPIAGSLMVAFRIIAAHALCAIVLIASLPAAAQTAPREIEYAYPDQSVWTTKANAQGELENPLLRLAAVLFTKADIPWHGRRYPASRMYRYLSDGTADFSMLVKAPVLNECCLISKNQVASTELRVYRRSGMPLIHGREDLVGRRVITIRGYSYESLLGYLADPANSVINNTALRHDAAFAMLEAGRGDYLVDYSGPAQEVLAAHPIAGIQYDVLSRLDVHMVLAKSYPDAAKVMANLEAIADSLNKDEILKPVAR